LVSRAVALVPQTELAGQSSSAVEAVRIFDSLAPDAVTLDVRLPDGDGIDLARHFRDRHAKLCVVLFGPPTPRLLRRAAEAGLLAYVPDTAGTSQAAAIIRSCLAGRATVSSRMRSALVHHNAPADLSRREQEVERLRREGLSPVEIAARLRLSQSTVRTYLSRARAKKPTDANGSTA
jgi:DNA-binding NarL/FixJ family response regulator